MKGKQKVVISTLVAALFIFSVFSCFQVFREKPAVVLLGSGFTSVGRAGAPIEVVLIEDFQCEKCRDFSKKVIPKLESKYVKAGKIRFTLVPVSFLAGSQEVANAVLEVYTQNPAQYSPYLKDLLIHEGGLKKRDLLRLAKRLRGIDLEKLRRCIENGCHNAELEKNLDWARGIMGAQFRTPTLYVNGAAGSTYSFEAIEYQIEQILGDQL